MPIALAAALVASACLARHPRLDRAVDAAPVDAAAPVDGGSTDPGRDAGTADAAVARDASGDWERVEIWLASTEGLLIGATLRGEPLVEATAPAEEGLRPSAHGLDVDGNGRVHVLIGRFGDHLITFDPRDGSWGPWRGASGLGNGSPPEHGGVAVMGPAVYVSDQALATRWSSGVVRYELEGDGPGERVGPEDWFNTWDVAAGDDGRLWVLGDYGVYTVDPVAGTRRLELESPNFRSFKGLTPVASTGALLLARGYLDRVEPDGRMTRLPIPEEYDARGIRLSTSVSAVDVRDDGMVVATGDGFVVVTTVELEAVLHSFRLPSADLLEVAFVPL